MSFFSDFTGGGDSSGGKATPTGSGGTGFDPTGGSNPLGMDPSLTGGWDPLSNIMTGGDGTSGGGNVQTAAASNPINDPNVGAPEANAPPGAPPATSIGGTPSGPQSGNLQNLVNQLTQRGGGQAAGAPAPTLAQLASRGDIGSDAPQPGVSDSGIAPTTQPLSMDTLQGRTDGQTAAGTGPTTAAATPPRGNVPVGAVGQPIPPSDTTTPTPPTATSPGQPPPGGASPEPAADQPQPPAPKADTNPPAPKADTTTPPATANTAPPAADPNAADPLSGQQAYPGGQQGYPGGSPTQQQQMTPAKLIGDVVKAMFGDPSGLLQDITGGQGAGDWESPGNPPGVPPWAPGYGPQSRINPNSPEARRIAAQAGRTGRTGGTGRTGRAGQPPQGNVPQTPPTPPSAEEANPLQTTSPGQPPPPGSTGGGPVNWQNIAAMPAATHAQNFNQPLNPNLKQTRAQFFQYADTHPEFKRRLFEIMGNEQSSNPQGTQGTLESLVNRVNSENLNFSHPRATGWYQQGGYYDHGGGRGDPRVLEQSYQNVKNGSDITDMATDNASNAATRNARAGLARREVAQGRFRNQSQYGGEWFQSPGSEGNRARYEQWRNQMKGGAGSQSIWPSSPRITGPDLLGIGQ